MYTYVYILCLYNDVMSIMVSYLTEEKTMGSCTMKADNGVVMFVVYFNFPESFNCLGTL